ncbi:J domain-containing protein [Corynebacterium frankenforstense]|uniref:J domain-containing protein n=1 Tax=Corynebacterium TaxID=1716 RepID=UPI00254B91A8|nr:MULTISPECIES: J domain-containing protein [Corynebacterium]MDK6259432.1 J domain-containing protein [Corynebacterium frankenforstense]MDK8895142.1 J domain-containing protein [Corynebacterium sp. MSK006]
MAHYDLYAVLGVSRGSSCDELAAEITRRLQTGRATNPGGADELRVALAVLGSPGRRARYDAVLDDPDAAPLTRRDINELASMPDRPEPQQDRFEAQSGFGPVGGEPQPQGRYNQQGAPGGWAGESASQGGWTNQYTGPQVQGVQTQGSSKTGIIITAVIGAFVIIAGLVIALLVLVVGRASDEAADEGDTSVSAPAESPTDSGAAGPESDSAEASGGASADGPDEAPAGGSDPRAMADEFMALDNRDDRTAWIEEHTNMDLVHEFAGDPSADAMSARSYASIQADEYTALADSAGGTPTIAAEYRLSENALSDAELEAVRKEFGADITDAYLIEFEGTGGEVPGILFAEHGGSWYFLILGTP